MDFADVRQELSAEQLFTNPAHKWEQERQTGWRHYQSAERTDRNGLISPNTAPRSHPAGRACSGWWWRGSGGQGFARRVGPIATSSGRRGVSLRALSQAPTRASASFVGSIVGIQDESI